MQDYIQSMKIVNEKPISTRTIELQDIFARYSHSFTETNTLHYQGIKAIKDILSCRTAALGRHVHVCDRCHTSKVSYNYSAIFKSLYP